MISSPNEEESFYYSVAVFGWLLAVCFFCVAWFVEAPYGKLASGEYVRFGGIKIPEIPLNPRLGWFLMELPATLSFLYFYPQGRNAGKPFPAFLAMLFLIHYSNRGFYFPYSIRVSKGQTQNFSIIIVLFGWLVTSVHGYLSGKWYSEINGDLADAGTMLTKPHFWAGLIIYEFGFLTTLYHEYIVRNLRTNAPGEPRYKIPRGGLFEYVTNAAYFSELVAWFGFALMTLNPGGLMVFLVSTSNLVPRAFQIHAWYKKQFGDDYPKERRVIIPFFL